MYEWKKIQKVLLYQKRAGLRKGSVSHLDQRISMNKWDVPAWSPIILFIVTTGYIY